MQNTFWSPSCICYNRSKQVQVIYMHFLMIKIRAPITRNKVSHYKHGNHNKYISQYFYGSMEDLYNVYIYYHFIKDNYCPDSIILWYVHTTFKVCMYITMRSLTLYQWGKEPISTNTCQSRNTCLYLRHIFPFKHRLVSVHIK